MQRVYRCEVKKIHRLAACSPPDLVQTSLHLKRATSRPIGFGTDGPLFDMPRLLLLVSMTCACALQRSYVVQPRGGLPSMSIDPCGFWQAKKARARHQMEKEILRLNEMMEREQMLVDQLFAPQQGCAVAVSTAADPDLQLELEQARAALAASEEQREVDVAWKRQREATTAAYWLEEVESLRTKLSSAEAAAAAAEAAVAAAWQQGVEAAAAEVRIRVRVRVRVRARVRVGVHFIT